VSTDDHDFPPLAPPTKVREPLPTPKSHVGSVQGSLDSPIRSSTPRIPPGLSLPHAHPSPSFAEDIGIKGSESKVSSSTPGPVIPALPMLPIGHRPASPRTKAKDEPLVPEEPTEDTKGGLPPKSGNDSSKACEKVDMAIHNAVETTDSGPESPQLQPSRSIDIPMGSSQKASTEKPETPGSIDKQSSVVSTVPLARRLDISAALAHRSQAGGSPSKINQQVPPQSLVATPDTIESLPSTPNASAPKFADWTSASRPRTLRLTTTMTPRAEAAPSSGMTERSTTLSAAVLKQTSRQPSLSSISRSHPSTPTVSEHGTSTGISRAGSPPASDIVGSAQERNKSKSQAKKERKAKSRATNESRDEEPAVPTPPISEVVGPIISRQKKKKRTQEKSSRVYAEARSGVASEAESAITAHAEKADKVETGKAIKEPSSPSSQDRPIISIKKSNAKARSGKLKSEKRNTPAASSEKEDQAARGATPRRSYTLNDLFNDAAKLPDTDDALSELLNASISATSRLLQELLDSNEIDLNSALFSAPPLTSYKLPPQSYKGADYLDANGYTMTSPFGEIYLSGHDRKQLLQGRDVRLSDPNKPQNVLKRTMITPSGAIFRHLSAEEEERVIELEDRMKDNEEKYGITGKSDLQPLDDMDFMNLTGGLQELMAFPPLHRISLLTAEPGTEDAEDDDHDLGGNGSDETEDDMAPLASGFGAAPEGPMGKPMTPNTMKRKAEALMTINLRNLDVDKLQKRIRETQLEMEGARKEMEVLEKKAARKAKDVARWRDALLKEVGRGL
jgi:CCR4-NOT transcription complex subunit 4